MKQSRLVVRSLRHYWQTGIVILLGIAVATAVIVGSLLIGDSVTGSLRDNALARLGKIEYALVAPHFFRASLADDLTQDRELHGKIRRIVPVITVRGAARNILTDVVTPEVNVFGVDESFWTLFPGKTAPPLTGRAVALNTALAHDLGVNVDDYLLVTIAQQSQVSADMLFAHHSREETMRALRVRVAAILPDAGAGSFRLDTAAGTPRNLFLSRAWLANSLDQADQVNALVVGTDRESHGTLLPALRTALVAQSKLTDYGLQVLPVQQQYLAVQSAGMVLTSAQQQAAAQAATACEARFSASSVYLATTLRDTRTHAESAYAIIAGTPPQSPFHFLAGGNQPFGNNAIWLNSWIAQDLQARVGDTVALDYFIPANDGSYPVATRRFTVRGIVDMSGPALDRALMPQVKGISGAERIDEWTAPFPVDLDRVMPRDETYWEQFRTTPKAFVTLPAAQALWQSGPARRDADWITSLQVRPPAGMTMTALTKQYTRVLHARISPDDAGLLFRPVRAQALHAAAGTTDFSQLFLAMSFFIVLAGAALAGMLMRLSADRRAVEAGTMLASGFSLHTVTRTMLAEGALLTGAGVVCGVPLGVLYAWGIVMALGSWWRGAVTTSFISLHLEPGSVLVGMLAGFLVGMLSMAWGTRALGRTPILQLLAGWQAVNLSLRQPGRKNALALLAISVSLAAVLLILSVVAKSIAPSTAFFGCGAALLVAGIASAQLILARTLAQRGVLPSLPRLAVRSAAANAGRSLLVVGLLASAAFIIVAVAANSRDFSRSDLTRRDSGTGGFTLQAIASLPPQFDLGSPTGREHLGLTPADEKVFSGVEVMPFLVSPGEDISCLNIARPVAPRMLGVRRAMVERGGFTVLTANGATEKNPWRLLESPARDGIIPVFGDADSVKWTLHSGLGQVYTIPGTTSHPIKVRFVGLISGSIFASELLMAENQFKQVYPGIVTPRYYLFTVQPRKAAALADVLRQTLGEMGFQVRSTAEVLNGYMRVQNTYLSMFMALGGLGVLLGTIGLVVVLLRGALERRSEFALMLATGFCHRDIAWLLMMENIGLLVVGVLCGTVAALIAVMPQLISVESQIHWLTVIGLLLGMVILGIVSCVVAARVAVRGDLLTALREE